MTKKLLLPILLLAALAVVLAGCGGGGGAPKSVPSDGVAVIGKQTITKDQFNSLLAQAKKTFKAQKRPFPKPGSQEYKALQDQAMNYLVQRVEFEQKAKDLGIEVSEAQIGARLTQIKKQYFGGDEKKYLAQLKAQGLTEEQVRTDIKSQLLSEAIFKKVTADVKVSDAEVSKYYSEHKSQYAQPESRDVRHILVNSKSLADNLYAQIKAGGDFARLAKKFSKDPGSAAQGGRLTISKGQTVPQFDKTAFALKVGEVSRPVHTQYGWHVIEALSPVRPAKQTPLKDVKESIRQQLLQTKKNEAMTKWVNDTKVEFAKKIAYQAGYAPLTVSTPTVTGATSTASK